MAGARKVGYASCMPELPEVETVARQLAPLLCGRRIRAVEVLDPLLGDPPVAGLVGRRVERVFRLGKQVVLTLTRQRHLAFHLRMTGRLIWAPRPREADHLRARLTLVGGQLLFCDLRRFGTLRVLDELRPIQPGGADPLCAGFTRELVAGLLRGSRQEIKTWLLRQDRIVGIGNIYASEILHLARIAPVRAAGSLRPREVARLHDATRRVLRRAVECCGTTFSDFQDARGLTGSYQRYLRVYGREGEPCPVCGRRVRRLVQQQRSTYCCTRCQR